MMFQFDSLAAFIAMDGHGFYIWLSYLITALVMVWLVAAPLRRKSQLFAAVKRQQIPQGKPIQQHHKAQQRHENGSATTGSEERAP